MLNKKDKIKKPVTIEMKGLQLIMGAIFLFASRLMVTGGLATLMLFAGAIMYGCGLWRWRKKDPACRWGVLAAMVLLLGVVTETWGYTADVSETVSLAVHGAATVAGTIAAMVMALLTFRVVTALSREYGAEETAQILEQRRWWIMVGYAVCGGWVLIDLLTGWMPNVGVIMRIASILLDIFFLSALFQVRKLLD